MNTNELADLIDSFTAENSLAIMYFALRQLGDATLRKVEIDEKAQRELTSDTIDELHEIIDEGSTVSPLSRFDRRENIIYEYDITPIPHELNLLNLALNDNEDIPSFDKDNDDLEGLKAIIIVLGTGTEKIAVYKHHYQTNSFRKSGFSILRPRGSNRFERLDQNIIRLSHTIDFVGSGDSIVVTNMKILEKFFGFKQAIKNQATADFACIQETGLISNYQDILTRIAGNDTTFARKIISAVKSSPVIGRVTNENIIDFVARHPILSKKLKTNADGNSFKLESKVSQNFFIKLLNDDYLKSELTRHEYDSDSKDLVANAPQLP